MTGSHAAERICSQRLMIELTVSALPIQAEGVPFRHISRLKPLSLVCGAHSRPVKGTLDTTDWRARRRSSYALLFRRCEAVTHPHSDLCVLNFPGYIYIFFFKKSSSSFDNGMTYMWYSGACGGSEQCEKALSGTRFCRRGYYFYRSLDSI